MIVEGILVTERYKKMLLELIAAFNDKVYVYYFDIPFEETLARHQQRRKASEFGSQEMRSWWVEKDYLNYQNEQRLLENLTLEEIVQQILDDIL